jgi:hypothetical protein
MADNLAKDTTERDLWDLDDLMIGDPEGSPAATIEPIRRHRVPPAPEPKPAAAKPGESKGPPSVPVLGGKASVVRRISRSERGRNPLSNPQTEGAGGPPVVPTVDRVEATFDDLEQWDERTGRAAVIEEVFDNLAGGITTGEPEEAPDPGESMDVSETGPETDGATAVSDDGKVRGEVEDNVDEFSPRAAVAAERISLRPKLAFNPLEKIGLACLLVLLLGGGVWAYRNTVSKLAGAEKDQGTEMPAKGSHVTIRGIKSYWRAPVTTGEKREIVRRGVVLIPVIEVTLTGKGAVRLLFRDDAGRDVGDPVVREVNGDTTLEIPATVGFEDISAHAAYQAGLTRPWQVRIADGPSASAAGSEFKEVARMPISPYLR